VAESRGVAGGDRPGQQEDLIGLVAVAALARERGEPQQGDGGQAVGAGRGVVHQVLVAGDEPLGVGAGGEHTAPLRVPEQVEEGVGGGAGVVDPAGLARGLGQADEGVGEGAVVGGVGEVAGPPVGLPGAQPAAVVAP